MSNKGIGFNRILKGRWLDHTAAATLETADLTILRRDLHNWLADDISSESRDRTIDILLRTWVKTGEYHPELLACARELFPSVDSSEERIWLHWGLLLLAYPFFRDAVAVVGRSARFDQPLSRSTITRQLASDLGQIASLDVGTGRTIALLKDWGMLDPIVPNRTYRVRNGALVTTNDELALWLLACALTAHASKAIPPEDLVALPELFPFRIDIRPREIRRSDWFETARYAAGELVSRRVAIRGD